MKRESIAAIVAVLVVASLGVSYLAATGMLDIKPQTPKYAATTNATSSAPIPAPIGGAMPTKLVLHTPQYVEGLVQRSLILPNASVSLGPSYKILGAMIDGPVNLTATNGSPWDVSIYLWNQSASSFVNGTTTDFDILRSGGIVVGEAGFPAGMALNNSAYAQSFFAPALLCSGKGMHPTPANSTCTTEPYTGQSYILTENGIPMVVNPEGPSVTWLDVRDRVAVTITGETQSVQQLLDLAGYMTEPLLQVGPPF